MKNRIFIKRFFLLSILFFFFCEFSIGQESCKITVLSGGQPIFIFNSLNKYTGGVTLEGWTRLKLEMDAPSQSSWKLDINALTATIISDGTAPDLDLDKILVRVNIESENQTANGGPLNNSYSPVTLVYDGVGYGSPILSGDFTGDGATNLIVILTISYDIGTLGIANRLLGCEPDYYFVDLEFTLTSIP